MNGLGTTEDILARKIRTEGLTNQYQAQLIKQESQMHAAATLKLALETSGTPGRFSERAIEYVLRTRNDKLRTMVPHKRMSLDFRADFAEYYGDALLRAWTGREKVG